MKTCKLRLNGKVYDQLRHHLFSGDGLESIAFALCGKLETENELIYTIHRLELYANEKCTIRQVDRVEWEPAEIVHLFEECRKNQLHLLKIHCHPKHWPFFSLTDDNSDIQLIDTVTGWTGRDDDIFSVIMLPDGSLFGRSINSTGSFTPLKSIVVISDNILVYTGLPASENPTIIEEEEDIQLRTRQAFGEGTTNILKSLKIGVVGCSGTGSIVAELLARLGVGQLVLVDYDIVERKNINRILNTTIDDAQSSNKKVDVIKTAIDRMGTGVNVISITDDLHSFKAYEAIAACDIVYGCMDTVDGRHLLNRIATYFCSAYLDIGIHLDADGKGGINEVFGRVDYIQPGGSSLLSRGRYTLEHLKAADIARTNPEEHDRQVKEGYIKSARVSSPAVISINMMFSSQAVTELLARLHPFRDLSNAKYASICFSVSGFLLINEPDGSPDIELQTKVGAGAKTPILDSPLLILPKWIER